MLFPVEELRPGAVLLLFFQSVLRQHQRVLRIIDLVGTWCHIFGRIAGREIDHLAQIYRSQQFPHSNRVIGIGLS